MKKIYIGSDHAGYELKEKLIKRMNKEGYEFEDFGADSDKSVDYPEYAKSVAKAVAKKKGAIGVLICGTGIGVSIAANKVKGAYAARCCTEEDADLARRHNGANIICLGGRQVCARRAKKMMKLFVNSNPEHARHERRRAKIKLIEKNG